MFWTAVLPTVQNDARTCCYPQRTASPTPSHTVFAAGFGSTDQADPSGWLYELMGYNGGDAELFVSGAAVSSYWPGTHLTLPYTGCPFTTCGGYSTFEVGPVAFATSEAFLLETSATTISSATATSRTDALPTHEDHFQTHASPASSRSVPFEPTIHTTEASTSIETAIENSIKTMAPPTSETSSLAEVTWDAVMFASPATALEAGTSDSHTAFGVTPSSRTSDVAVGAAGSPDTDSTPSSWHHTAQVHVFATATGTAHTNPSITTIVRSAATTNPETAESFQMSSQSDVLVGVAGSGDTASLASSLYLTTPNHPLTSATSLAQSITRATTTGDEVASYIISILEGGGHTSGTVTDLAPSFKTTITAGGDLEGYIMSVLGGGDSLLSSVRLSLPSRTQASMTDMAQTTGLANTTRGDIGGYAGTSSTTTTASNASVAVPDNASQTGFSPDQQTASEANGSLHQLLSSCSVMLGVLLAILAM